MLTLRALGGQLLTFNSIKASDAGRMSAVGGRKVPYAAKYTATSWNQTLVTQYSHLVQSKGYIEWNGRVKFI